MADWRQDIGSMMAAHEQSLISYASVVSADVGLAGPLVEKAMATTFARRRPVSEREVRRAVALAYLSHVRSRERRRAFRHMVSADAALDATPITSTALVDPTFQALRRLSPRARTCVVLSYVDELTVAEIAHLLSMHPGRVRHLISDGVERLEKSLGAFEDTHVDAIRVEVHP